MVQPGQQNGNALIDAFMDALTATNVRVCLVTRCTQRVTLAV